MEVRGDDARERPAGERPGEQALPECARVLEPDAGVDGGHAAPVVEEPEVDVVQPERERHAEPRDARRHRDDLARPPRLRPRIIRAHPAGLPPPLRPLPPPPPPLRPPTAPVTVP